jgi:hypothetical protein
MKLLPLAAGAAAAPAGAQYRYARRAAVGLGNTALVLLLAVAAIVLWRRAAGALHEPAGPPLGLAVGIVAASLAAAVRLAPRDTLRLARWQRLAWAAAPSLGLLTLGASLSVAGMSWPAMAAMWGPMLIEEAWAVGRHDRALRDQHSSVQPHEPAPLLGPAFGLITASLAEPEADGQVTQQLTRSRADDGSEVLAGWLRLAFEPGQRQATAHLAFCPPFAQVPELDVRQIEGPAARVKTGQVLPYGARLEVKLNVAAEHPLDIRLRFSARADGNEA